MPTKDKVDIIIAANQFPANGHKEVVDLDNMESGRGKFIHSLEDHVPKMLSQVPPCLEFKPNRGDEFKYHALPAWLSLLALRLSWQDSNDKIATTILSSTDWFLEICRS